MFTVTGWQGRQAVFLTMTYNEKEEVADFLKEHTFDYNLLVAPRHTDKACNVSSRPVNFVIDKEGIIKFVVRVVRELYVSS